MMDATKYAPGYYPVPAGYDSWVKKDHIEKAPAWCSVDLRDGNQALIVPKAWRKSWSSSRCWSRSVLKRSKSASPLPAIPSKSSCGP